MAVLPEAEATTKEVTIDDIQVDDPHATPDEREQLRRIIWKRCHLLIGTGNALPPAVFGAICDIDVGTAKPVAQRCRRAAPQFREKLSMLIKGLLSAKITTTTSISPWAAPIVVTIKVNGVDIRLCIDYQVVNSLTRLMVYPMPLINDLLEDLDKALWYCSLDMASGFWVVSMTPRARLVSAFITPFGLFEWTRMPFGLKNAPQIYQRIVDNGLYGHISIKPDHDRSNPVEPRLRLRGRRDRARA
ncbi:reverse transcriptase [Phytophthora megakarya]|uniref:Reverse transcriptase n=1 Tax=Phytophthora megakarya TaxID=4795 RepID=A0A225UDR5_9STRA|nr:reverse transcriptase [Phytophthora megakarya]